MIFLAIFEYAILASTFTISKIAVSFSNPLFLTAVRMLASGPIILLIYFLSGGKVAKFYKKDYGTLLKVSLFHIFIPFVGEFWALKYVSSIKSAITYSLTPFIAAALSFFLRKTKLSLLQIFSLALGFLGLCSLFVSSSHSEELMGEFFYISLPEAVLFISVASASYAWFLVTDLLQKGYAISTINAYSMILGGLLSLLVWAMFYQLESPLTGSLEDFAIWTGLLILVANVISYNFYGWLLKHISINLMSAIGFLCPIFAAIFGFLFLGETIGTSHIFALLLVTVGISLFYKEEISAKKKLSYEK